MTGMIAAFVEAWSEVRIHKVRVLLSLIGVLVAVLAMTIITAIGDMARQANAEYSERTVGRPATVQISAYTDGVMLDPAAMTESLRKIVERHSIEYASLVAHGEQIVRFPDGSDWLSTQTVDRSYGEMHRIEPVEGSWFTAADERRYAPSLVINTVVHERLGSPDLRTNPTVMLGGERPVRAVIVGVVDTAQYGDSPFAYVLTAAQERWLPASPYGMTPTLEMWVPPGSVDELTEVITSDLTSLLGQEQPVYVDVYRVDSEDFELIDSQLAWVIRGVSLIALAMGALGLVNIALVTVRYRIREIGIRRSFGATSARIFFAVMMESVCATVVAGLVGVALAVLIVENVPMERLIGGAVADVPPFPVRAAVEGMVAATAVGALAGLLPATAAVRAKVIDAIRY